MGTHVPFVRPWFWAVVLGLLLGASAVAAHVLWPDWVELHVNRLLEAAHAPTGKESHEPTLEHHSGGESTTIRLSPAGLKNVGFRPITIRHSTFVKTLNLPGKVVERPGRSQIHITAPLTGVVTRIYPIQGASVSPGSPMFDVRLTHEELVTAQRDIIRTAENLEVVNREIARLRALGEGIVAGKQILEQEYQKQKLEASLKAERQALLLHGLNAPQIDGILQGRELFQLLTIRAPAHVHEEPEREAHLFHVQQMPVSLGQHVDAGQRLCVLADHCELYIEGVAFEDDAAKLREAMRLNRGITARLLTGRESTDSIEGLKLLYLADQIDSQSRALRFYVRLENEVEFSQEAPPGVTFVDWRYKPGQRMELRVPVGAWENQIVVPVGAVVEDGAEAFVYQQNGELFQRVAVHVKYRDQTSAVLADDGSLFQGDVIAGQGAYQIHLALKNQTGGGVDPHAGHNH